MNQMDPPAGGLLLNGLDGANPLAFLAALGTLRGLTIAWPERDVRLSWALRDAWRPGLHVDGGAPSRDEVLAGLEVFLERRPGHGSLGIGDDLTIQADRFRVHALDAAAAAAPSPQERAGADFIAAFGCDGVARRHGEGQVHDTALRTMSGTGHQHFLRTMRDLADRVGRDRLRQSLFSLWERLDPQLSLRWDPEEDRRYALRWRNPSNDVVSLRGQGSGAPTEWGANRLSYEALPLFPVMPAGRSAQTTGFSGAGRSDTRWTWPIWDAPAGLDVVRSLLAIRELQEDTPARQELAAMGIRQVFRSRRITTGQFRNFTPSVPV